MYIDPFVAGVLCTVGAEIMFLFVAALVATFKKVKRRR